MVKIVVFCTAADGRNWRFLESLSGLKLDIFRELQGVEIGGFWKASVRSYWRFLESLSGLKLEVFWIASVD